MPSILLNLGRCTNRVHLTLAHRIALLGLMVGLVGGVLAGGPLPNASPKHWKGAFFRIPLQQVSETVAQAADPITLGETRAVMLDGTGPALLSFEAEGGEVVTIIARTLEPDSGDQQARNVVVDVLSPDGRRLAYNDNHFGVDDDLLPTDAAIEKLVLPERGVYTIRVNTYGGIFPGAVEVRLTAADLYEAAFSKADGLLTITALLPQNGRYAYTFEGSAGDVMRVTARDTADTLDPVLRLVDEAGALVAFNDDHGTESTALDVFDALLDGVTLPADGHYTLIVTDFLGRAGTFEVRIEVR